MTEVDSASSKSVRIAEIRFTQNFIFLLSPMIYIIGWHLPGGRVPPRDRGKKIPRAHGGCLGMGSRRRARQAAISPGEAQTAFDPGIPEWGNPAGVMPCCPHPNQIGCEEATGGTETSKYPEERKSTETPGVAASETGLKPKPAHVQATGRCCAGVAGRAIPRACSLGRSYKS